MTLIDGRLVANKISSELKKEIELLKLKNIIPTLVIIQVGNVLASNVYVKNKMLLSEKMGAKTLLTRLDESITTDELVSLIQKYNNDPSINGILVQMPLPKHIDESKIIETIDSYKDVDCFKLDNVGKLWTARKSQVLLQPCTPAGIIQLLKHNNIEVAGKKAIIIGRSNIVGKPMGALLLLEDATVTIAHSKTANLKQLCQDVDIIIAAIGKAKFVTKDFVSSKSIIIDVGMNRDENNKLCGDVDFEQVKDIVSYITPVPGGVGPMTVVMLMKNLIELTKYQHNIGKSTKH